MGRIDFEGSGYSCRFLSRVRQRKEKPALKTVSELEVARASVSWLDDVRTAGRDEKLQTCVCVLQCHTLMTSALSPEVFSVNRPGLYMCGSLSPSPGFDLENSNLCLLSPDCVAWSTSLNLSNFFFLTFIFLHWLLSRWGEI